VHERDHRLDVSTSANRKQRSDIPVPAVLPGANGWETGRTVQITLAEANFRR